MPIKDLNFYERFAVEIESSDGYVRKTTIGGHPAFKSFTQPDAYTMMVLVGERFLVVISAETEASLDRFSNLLDYNGIATLR